MGAVQELTLLFTDIEGSTRLWELDRSRMSDSLAWHDREVRAAIEIAGGVVFKTVGDGFCAVFEGPDAGIRAAVDAQRRTRLPPAGGLPLRVRAGLHTGVCERRDADYFGPAVNRVARLMATAHGGQVVVSGRTAALAASRLPDEIELLDLGEHRLKDLQEPERVHQVAAPGLERSFPPLRSLGNPALRHNLPASLPNLIGRRDELRTLIEMVAARRLVTLLGPGGVGKTRLALQLAAELLDGEGDGTFFIDLAPLAADDDVASAAARALRLRALQAGHELDEAIEALRDRKLLLILDNCEHVIGGSAALAAAILRDCPNIVVVATSREPLHISGEVIHRVPPLALPPEHADPDELEASPAVELFRERAGDHGASLPHDGETQSAIVSICRKLDGIPLAIELAAARVHVLGAQALDRRLDHRFGILRSPGRDRLLRQRTLENLVAWSYDLLEDDERRTLARMCAFRGGCDLEAIEAVCFADELVDAPLTVGSLVDKSLVVSEPGKDGAPRFRLLESIREYAAARLDATEHAALLHRHRSYFGRMARQGAKRLYGRDQVTWLAKLEAESDNLRAALSSFVATGDIAEAVEVTEALRPYWVVTARTGEGVRWTESLLELPEVVGSNELTAPLLSILCDLRCRTEPGAALSPGETALALIDPRDEPLLGRTHRSLGWANSNLGHFARALAHLAEAEDLARRSDDEALLAYVLLDRASTLWRCDEPSLALFASIAAAFAERGDQAGLSIAHMNLGYGYLGAGRVQAARTALETALAAAQAVGNPNATLTALLNLGLAEHLADRDDRSNELYRSALRLADTQGSEANAAYALLGLALTEARTHPERAAFLLGASDASFTRRGHAPEALESRARDAVLPVLHEALGTAEVEAARDAGRAASRRDVYRRALSPPPGADPARQAAERDGISVA